MRKLLFIIISLSTMMLQSCYTTQTVDYYPSVVNDLKAAYQGKTKSYIIENYPYAPSDIKNLGDGYEILIFQRWRNNVVGYGITKFHLKNGKCYDIETNEYKHEQRRERVRIL